MNDIKPIKIRATTLESYALCPYRAFKQETDGIQCREAVLKIGTFMHLAMQSPLIGKMLVYQYGFNIKDRDIALELIRHAPRFPKADMYELEVDYTLEKYNVRLIGHIDEITVYKKHVSEIVEGVATFTEDKVNGEPTLHLIDNKTSASKWTIEDYSTKFQRYIYSYLAYLNLGIKRIVFTYRVFPKKKMIQNDDVMEFSEIMDIDECEKKVAFFIENYLQSTEDNLQKKWSKFCFSCPYKEECRGKAKDKLKTDTEIKEDFDFKK